LGIYFLPFSKGVYNGRGLGFLFLPLLSKSYFLGGVEGGCVGCSGTWGFFLSKISKILHIWGVFWVDKVEFLSNSKGVVFWVGQGRFGFF
jgi:hypothetical protein